MLFVAFSLLIVTIQAASLNSGADNGADPWLQFKKDYNKTYKDANDEQVHMAAYTTAQQVIQKHNAEYAKGLHTFNMAINELADLTPEEYKARNGFRHPGTMGNAGTSPSHNVKKRQSLPSSLDWRQYGMVTPVKNQGGCGSCWAFAAIAALEGRHMYTARQLVSLSEQNLIDCDTQDGACGGGWMGTAWAYVNTNNGVDTETSYPYTSGASPYQAGTCKFNKNNVGAVDTGTAYVSPQNDETALASALLNNGVIAVAIDASLASFQHYSSGVYYDAACSTTTVDHGVIVVGYGTDPVQGDYWILKNSWGTGWGEAGYMRLARNKNNACGIAVIPVYPTCGRTC